MFSMPGAMRHRSHGAKGSSVRLIGATKQSVLGFDKKAPRREGRRGANERLWLGGLGPALVGTSTARRTICSVPQTVFRMRRGHESGETRRRTDETITPTR